MTSGWLLPEPEDWREVITRALAEDIGTGDVSAPAVPAGTMTYWYIEAQQEGVVCGVAVAANVLSDSELLSTDGDTVGPGTLLLRGRSDARHVLTHERTALNFLMHLSGVATLTAQFVKAIEGTGCRLLDTRKTTPGLRHMEKYAVRCGGGTNLRAGLYDMVMLKDNHLQAAGSIAAAVAAVRPGLPAGMKIEVECADLAMVDEAVAVGADVVMLDNMSMDDMSEAVRRHRGKTKLEASGGVTLSTVRAIAETGVDFISVGAITHSAPALSIHLEFGTWHP